MLQFWNDSFCLMDFEYLSMEKGIAKHVALCQLRGNVAIAICGVDSCVLHFCLVTKFGVYVPFVRHGRFASIPLRRTYIT
jgi:hypothetical protein